MAEATCCRLGGPTHMDLVTAVAAPQLPVLAHEWLLPALPRQIWQMLAGVGSCWLMLAVSSNAQPEPLQPLIPPTPSSSCPAFAAVPSPPMPCRNQNSSIHSSNRFSQSTIDNRLQSQQSTASAWYPYRVYRHATRKGTRAGMVAVQGSCHHGPSPSTSAGSPQLPVLAIPNTYCSYYVVRLLLCTRTRHQTPPMTPLLRS